MTKFLWVWQSFSTFCQPQKLTLFFFLLVLQIEEKIFLLHEADYDFCLLGQIVDSAFQTLGIPHFYYCLVYFLVLLLCLFYYFLLYIFLSDWPLFSGTKNGFYSRAVPSAGHKEGERAKNLFLRMEVRNKVWVSILPRVFIILLLSL